MTGLAILDAYRDLEGAEGIFIGCKGGLEERLVPAHGVTLHLTPGTPFARQGLMGKAGALWSLLAGAAAARRILKQKRVQVVIGAGGYASAGTILGARSLGLPIVVHEANAEPGLANRMAGRLADVVCVGFPEAASAFAPARTVLTGNPARNFTKVTRGDGPVRVLVSGGSLGSAFLNAKAPELLARIPGIEVQHITGQHAAGPVRAAYQAHGMSQARVDEFLLDISQAYRDADFVITSAGAVTMTELSLAGLPALLVPLGWAANDHQSANARAYTNTTGSMWVRESEWEADRLANLLQPILMDRAKLAELGVRARAWSKPDAARDIVKLCEELALRNHKDRNLGN